MNTVPPSETLATMNADGSRRWLTPKVSPGRHHGRRGVTAWLLIALFVAIPFVRVGGQPLFLFDLARRELHLFGSDFYANDVVLLTFLLLAIFLTIFLLTAVLGRVWCGWGCPQTVYMEWVFRPIERLFSARGRKDRPFFIVAKYVSFALISIGLSHVFLGYFVRMEALAGWVTDSPFRHPGAFGLVMGVSGLIFFDFAWFREQMCTVICPYARLQSALLDRSSLIVAYDARRGEPRGKLRVLNNDEPRGDCVDCNACVSTCPTGIDIRNGLQLECIACAQCADACDGIMQKLGRPEGLVRYATREELERAPGADAPRRFRPRLVIYPALLTVVLSILGVQLWRRAPADVLVIRAPGVPFVETAGGSVMNAIRVRIRNRTSEPHTYRLSVEGDAGLTLSASHNPVAVAPGEMLSVDALIEAPRANFQAGEPRYTVVVADDQNPTAFTVRKSDRLLGPVGSRRNP